MIFYIFLIIFQCYNTAVKRLMSFDGMSQSALPTFYQNLKSETLVSVSFDYRYGKTVKVRKFQKQIV